MIASCGFLEDELRQYIKEEGVTMANSVETLGVDLGTIEENLGAKAKSEQKEVQSEIRSLFKKREAFRKNCVKVEAKKLLRAGMVPAKTWRVHAVGMAQTERLQLRRQVAAAAGKQSTTSLSLFMEASGLEVEEDLSTWPPSVRQKEYGLENGQLNRNKHG